jgi:hypothetical protein
VPDPQAGRTDPAALDLLTEHEHRALQRLHELGDVRLEQERLAWPWVSERLEDALALVLEGERTSSGSTPPADPASSRPR